MRRPLSLFQQKRSGSLAAGGLIILPRFPEEEAMPFTPRTREINRGKTIGASVSFKFNRLACDEKQY